MIGNGKLPNDSRPGLVSAYEEMRVGGGRILVRDIVG